MSDLTPQDMKVIKAASRIRSFFVSSKVTQIIVYVIILLGFIDLCSGQKILGSEYFFILMATVLFLHAWAQLQEAYIVIQKLTQDKKDRI